MYLEASAKSVISSLPYVGPGVRLNVHILGGGEGNGGRGQVVELLAVTGIVSCMTIPQLQVAAEC